VGQHETESTPSPKSNPINYLTGTGFILKSHQAAAEIGGSNIISTEKRKGFLSVHIRLFRFRQRVRKRAKQKARLTRVLILPPHAGKKSYLPNIWPLKLSKKSHGNGIKRIMIHGQKITQIAFCIV